MESLFKRAIELMDDGRVFAYATIVSSTGSTPRKTGSTMLVLDDSIIGTTGGGVTEYNTIVVAREEVIPQRCAKLLNMDLSPKPEMDDGLICGGEYDVLLFCVAPDDVIAREVFSACAEAQESQSSSTIYYIYDARDAAAPKCHLAACINGGEVVGRFEGIGAISRKLLEDPIRVGIHCADEAGVICFSDTISVSGSLCIFGAGHVSKEVAFLAKHLGYRVLVVDDRAEFANQENFPGCETLVLDSFDDIPEIGIGSNGHILVITRGHVNDREALYWALTQDCAKDSAYIGMIGSRSKKAALYDRLRESGMSEESLAKVHCPIGLSIGAQTPAEIAVSIMGEIIACDHDVDVNPGIAF